MQCMPEGLGHHTVRVMMKLLQSPDTEDVDNSVIMAQFLACTNSAWTYNGGHVRSVQAEENVLMQQLCSVQYSSGIPSEALF